MLDAVKEWGLRGDGEADSTDAFLRMRAALLGDRDRMWEIEFAPGRYLTRAPHWLEGVGRVRLIGHGATLQQATPNYGLFATGEPFLSTIWTPPFTSFIPKHHAGYRIASVEAGANEIGFLETPPALSPDAIVFIGGHAQQFQQTHLPEDRWELNGWPPNLRWFEYARVTAFDGTLATLDRPLAHAYDESWRDYPGDYFGAYTAGAPRLYLCNRPDFNIPLHIEFRGFAFARAAGSTAGGHVGLTIPALSLVLEDCSWPEPEVNGSFVAMNDRVTLRRCRAGGFEIDKCLRHVLIEDCDFAGSLTSDGAGALEVEVRRSRICGDFRVNPRASVVLDGVTAFSNFSLNAQHGGYYDTTPFAMTVRATRP
jgi:hypothetical protein